MEIPLSDSLRISEGTVVLDPADIRFRTAEKQSAELAHGPLEGHVLKWTLEDILDEKLHADKVG